MPVLTKINTNSIAEDAITGDKFAGDAYLSNTANQNISGTYSENRLYTSDAYTLSANATVNSHLTLSTVKPTGDVVLTAGGAYTLTGSGTDWVNTTLTAAITPTATSSKILITYSVVVSVNTTGYSAITSVFRGDGGVNNGINLGGPSPDYGTAFHGTSHLPAPHAAVVIDTPSTTSATTYTIGVRESADNQTYYCSNSSRATIIVQEIAG